MNLPDKKERSKWLGMVPSIILSFVVVVLFACLLGVGKVEAAEPDFFIRDAQSYSAKYVFQSESDPVEIEAGTVKTVKFKFKNTGSATWNSQGSRFVSAYAVEPRYRKSLFQGGSWLGVDQTGKISGPVAPGEIGDLDLEIRAPEKVGEYVERFYLAAENYSWFGDGYFFIKIKVIPKKVVIEEKVEEPVIQEEYVGRRVVLNKKSVKAIGGEKIKLIVGVRNKGTATWQKYLVKVGDLTTVAAISQQLTFADHDWVDESVALSGGEVVKPGDFLRTVFYFRTPTETGSYIAKFIVEVDENELKDVLIEIPVEVTENAPENYQAPIFKKEEVKYVPRLSEEPRVRVGIKAPAEYLQFSSNGDDYLVFAGSKKMGVLPKKKLGIFEFKNEQYSFRGGDLSFDSDTYIHLEPENNESAVFTLHNLKRYASWLSSASFNKYRGAVEYRQGQVDKQMYAVNDLLMEDYVKGIAENSSRAPDEFVKANLVAARNYAYYSREKYPFFDVLGSTYDQLYLGCLAEDILPNVVKAAKATRGVMVLYDDEIVTTPYFGNSNGWTRSWPSVWGGTKKPWLVPVRAGYDAGRSQFGHGVGMSQRDAAYRAEKEGLGFDELLKYYYTGVEVEQIYL